MAQSSPLRVLVIVSHRSSLVSRARESPQDLIPLAIRLLRKNNITRDVDLQTEIQMLAVQKWKTRVFFVFDIGHINYDATLGHLPEHNRLPVVVAYFSKKKAAYAANPWVTHRVNHDVGMLHNANGFNSLPPFVEDHTLGKPRYQNPRDITMLRVTYI